MLFQSVVAAAAFGVASAQNFIPVQVGMGGTVFSPNKITAAVGDTIQFQFMGGNHTVTQSTFDQPCVPISMSNASVVGFHSGFFPAAQAQAQGMIPAWNLVVNQTGAIWAYCAQGRHCQSGMALVINEPVATNQSRTLENYQALASNVAQAQVPAIAAGGQGGTINQGDAATGTGQNNGGNTAGTGNLDPAATDAAAQPGNSASGLQISSAALALAGAVALFL